MDGYIPSGTPNDIALYEHAPPASTLQSRRLRSSQWRRGARQREYHRGEEVVFYTTRDRIRPEHIHASAAITPGFPPVEIEGRFLCDPRYVNNTPIDIALAEPPSVDTICIAVELFSLLRPRPKSLDAVIERTQDIMFASPTRRSIAGLIREYDLRVRLQDYLPMIQLLHSVYQPPSHELSLKTLDFSSRSIGDRWSAGAADLQSGLDLLGGASKRGLNYMHVRRLGSTSSGGRTDGRTRFHSLGLT